MKKEEDVVEMRESSNKRMIYRVSHYDKLSKEINSVIEDVVMDYIFDEK